MNGPAPRVGTAVWRGVGLALAFAFLIPVIVSQRQFPPAWDDAYFLHRATCVNRAIAERSVAEFRDCVSIVSKSPLMVLLSAPWGTFGRSIDGLGAALVSLEVLSWALAALVLAVALRIGVPPFVVAACAAALSLDPLVVDYGGTYLADTVFALAVTLTLLLIRLERGRQDASLRAAAARGVLWAAAINAGLLSKLPFLFFLAWVAPPVLWLRVRAVGARAALATLGVAVALSLGAVALNLVILRQATQHALDASYGLAATFYAHDGGARAFLTGFAARNGAAYGLALLVLIAGAARHRRGGRADLAWDLYPLLVLAMFLGLIATSPNRDDRFGLPISVALPFLIASTLGARGREGVAPSSSAPQLAWFLLAGVLVSLPAIGRLDLRYVREADAVLSALPPSGKLLLGTDDGRLNVETFLLARELAHGRLGTVAVDTLVYDPLHGLSLEASLARLRRADYVALKRPPLETDPPWANRNAERYRVDALARGALVEVPGSSMMDLVRLAPAPPR